MGSGKIRKGCLGDSGNDIACVGDGFIIPDPNPDVGPVGLVGKAVGATGMPG
jgi:hypothetical protein